MSKLHIITPVKDSVDLAEKAVRAIVNNGLPEDWIYTIYDDNSTPENRKALDRLAEELGIGIVHLDEITDNPSPNYLTVLKVSRDKAVGDNADMCIVESDVIVRPDTLEKLHARMHELPSCGMIGAVTVDEQGEVNYPYNEEIKFLKVDGDLATPGHLTFCCTILALPLLEQIDFDSFQQNKSWFDVPVSQESVNKGMSIYACLDIPVTHYPHGSRPWKRLKKTNRLKYYWLKYTKGIKKA